MTFGQFSSIIPDLPIAYKPSDRCEAFLEIAELLELNLAGLVSLVDEGKDRKKEIIELFIDTFDKLENLHISNPTNEETLFVRDILNFVSICFLATNLFFFASDETPILDTMLISKVSNLIRVTQQTK